MKSNLSVMLDIPANCKVDEQQIVKDFYTKFVECCGGETEAYEAVKKAIEKDPDTKLEDEDVFVEMPINRFICKQYDAACKFAFRHVNSDVSELLRVVVGLMVDRVSGTSFSIKKNLA